MGYNFLVPTSVGGLLFRLFPGSNRLKPIIKYTQEVGSDPIGIGDIVRAKHNNYWNSISWSDAYKKALINVDVNLDIKTYGTID